MGAGILPICLFNSKLLFLFGKESKTSTWSDFGGTTEKNETEFETAIREGAEELNGFLGYGQQLAKLVNNNNLLTIKYDKYKIFVFLINFDKNLPIYFLNNYNFLNSHLLNTENIITTNNNSHSGLFEKAEIKWFTCQDLKNERDKFRLFYRPIIDIIINEYDNLLVKTKQLKYK